MAEPALQYLADERGAITAVVVPISAWREIAAELETQHLLRSPAMRARLQEAMRRTGGASLDEVMGVIGVSNEEVAGETP